MASVDPTPSESEDGLDTRRLKAALRSELFGRPADPQDERIGRFVLLRRLGEGGMGTVFEAHDPALDRTVALKLIRADRRDAQAGPALIREARALGRLSHPNVVSVFEVGRLGDEVFVAMELVRGRTLRAWARELERGPRRWRTVLGAYRQAALGLEAAHRAGIVHRDFKPDNALIGDDALVRVVDFGLAGADEDWVSEQDDAAGLAAAEAPTLRSRIAGTPRYMPPEQFVGHVDARADQYALCVSVYEALYGEVPREVDRRWATSGRAWPDVKRPRDKAAAPGWVFDVLRRGLELEPRDRFASMTELRRALLEDPRRWRRWIAGSVVAAGAAVAAIVHQPSASEVTCVDVEAPMAREWNSKRATAIERAFRDVAPSIGPGSFAAVRRAVDDYSGQWSRSRRASCEATRLHRTQTEDALDRRTACLDRALFGLSETLALLDAPDVEVVAAAPRAVAALPVLARCDDPQRLAAAVAAPQPGQAAAVAGTQRRLAKAEALHRGGLYARAAQRAQDVVREAAEVGYAPLVAEAELLLGRALERTARVGSARRHLEGAFWGAYEANDADLGARSALALAALTAGTLKDRETGRDWTRRAEALMHGRPEASHLRPQLLAAQAALASEHGRFDEAAALVHEAAALLEERPHELTEAALLKVRLGMLLRERGRNEEGIELYRAAVDVLQQALGPEHSEVGRVRSALGTALRRLDPAAARRELEAALEIQRASLGPQHREVAGTLLSLGTTLDMLGEPAQTRELYDEALAIVRSVAGNVGIDEIQILSARAAHERSRDKLEAAERTIREAIRLGDAALDDEDPERAGLIHDLALIRYRRGAYEDALELARQAHALRVRLLGPDHIETSRPLATVSQTLQKLGRLEEAATALTKAYDIKRRAWGDDDPRLEMVLSALGTLEMRRRRFTVATDYFQRSIARAEAAYGKDDKVLISTLIGLGRAAWMSGSPEDAVGPLRRALDIAELRQAGPMWRAWARFNLARAMWDAGEQRARAQALAAEALALYGELEAGAGGNRSDDVREWLREHRR